MNIITIEIEIKAGIEKVWEYWTSPRYIVQWNFASDTWHCPSASNELVPNGKFVFRMEAKDGSVGFDFEGTYQQIDTHQFISYKMEDGRMVEINFQEHGDKIRITESFEPEGTHSDELQKQGWTAILQNFKALVESNF